MTGGNGFYAPDGRSRSMPMHHRCLWPCRGAGGDAHRSLSRGHRRATRFRHRPRLRADITGTRNGYRLDATADTDYGPLTADVVLGTGNQLTLDINSANLAGIDFSGSLSQTPAGPFAGRLDANGRGVAGIVRLDAVGQYQQALVNLRARDTVLPGPANLAIGSAIVDARIILYDQPYVVADAQLAQTVFRSLNLNAARAKIDYRDGSGTAKVLAEGVSGVPFRVAANANSGRPAARRSRGGCAGSTLRPPVRRVSSRARANTNCCPRGSISAVAIFGWRARTARASNSRAASIRLI